jgi:glycosyltransferase involved in cell wall biosynthesis
MKKKIKVGLIIGQLIRGGGAEKQIIAIAEGLNKEHFDPYVISLSETSLYTGQNQPQSFRVYALRRRSHFDVIRLVQLIKIFKKEKFDIVHSFLPSDNFYTFLASKTAGIKKVITSSRACYYEKNFLKRTANKIIYRKSPLVIANSRAGIKFLNEFYGCDIPKLRLLYNGVEDVTRVAKGKCQLKEEIALNDSTLLCSIGRLDYQKNHEVSISIMPKIIKNNNKIKFVIIGTGVLHEKLQSMIQNLKLQNHVFLLGKREDVYDILLESDIFILSSRYEGLPNVILEAMSAAKPVIATNIGGSAELIIDNQNGFLIEKNDKQALLRKLDLLIEDENLRVRMGKEGRKIAQEKFSMEIMIEKAEAIYRELAMK